MDELCEVCGGPVPAPRNTREANKRKKRPRKTCSMKCLKQHRYDGMTKFFKWKSGTYVPKGASGRGKK